MAVEVVFAWTVAVLAAAATVGALAVAIAIEWYALRKTIAKGRADLAALAGERERRTLAALGGDP
jgi:hypothetical protein